MARWPRFQLSLRMFLLLMLAISAFLSAWLAPAVRMRARTQAFAVFQAMGIEHIRRNDGDWQREMIAWQCGLERPFHLTWLTVEGATDADCDRLALFTELTELRLRNSHITLAGFQKLLGLRQLTGLYIESPQLDDRIAPLLANFPALKSLCVAQTACGDEVLVYAATKPDMRLISGGSRSTDRGLSAVLKLPTIHWIALSGTGVNGAALVAADPNPQLHYLTLAEAPLSPAALQALVKFTNLSNIDLRAARVEPDFIPVLQRLPALYSVGINVAHWSPADYAALEQVLPELKDENTWMGLKSRTPHRIGGYFEMRASCWSGWMLGSSSYFAHWPTPEEQAERDAYMRAIPCF